MSGGDGGVGCVTVGRVSGGCAFGWLCSVREGCECKVQVLGIASAVKLKDIISHVCQSWTLDCTNNSEAERGSKVEGCASLGQ